MLARGLSQLGQTTVATSKTVDGLSQRVRAIEQFPWKVVRWLGLAVAGSAISILISNVWLHAQTAHQAVIAAQAAGQAAAASTQTNRKIDALSNAIGVAP